MKICNFFYATKLTLKPFTPIQFSKRYYLAANWFMKNHPVKLKYWPQPPVLPAKKEKRANLSL